MSSFSFTNRLLPPLETSKAAVLIRQALRHEVLSLQTSLSLGFGEEITDFAECKELVDECLGLALGAIDEHSSEKHIQLANNQRTVLASCEGLRLDASWPDILNARMAPWFTALEICEAKPPSFDKLRSMVSEERRIEHALALGLDPNASWQDIEQASVVRGKAVSEIGKALKAQDFSAPGVGQALLSGLLCHSLTVPAIQIDPKVFFLFLMKIEITPYPNVTLGEIGDRVRAWRAAQLEAVEARFQRKANTLLFEDYFEFALGYSFRNGRDDTDMHLDRTGS